MHIIKYLLSKSYRHSYDSEYTKRICDTLAAEQDQEEDIYNHISGNNVSI